MANRKQKTEKRREARMRQTLKKQHRDKELEVLLDDEELDSEDEILEIQDEEAPEGEEVEEAPQEVKKEYEPYYGPTSWGEAEAEERAREQAEEVMETAWTAERLVRNIIYRADMSPEEKGNAIANVGTGFGERVKSITADTMKKGHDMDVLEINAMLGIDSRHTPTTEKIGDWIRKAVLSERSRKQLSDDDFALVYEVDGKKVRKYPIQDKAHVRNALARAAQMIEKGGQAAEDARKALPKIRAAAKKMGIGVEKSSAVVIEKDAKGEWRAVLWPTNNFKDRDGEIIADSAHAEYVEWVNKNMSLAPVFMTWHVPGTARTHPMDFVGYENGFMIASAPLTENEAAAILKMQAQVDLGLSIGGFALERDKENPLVITKYRMYEVSDLPLERASNPFTEFQVFTKEADVDTLEYLAGILGNKEKAQEYVEKAGIKQAALRKAGVAEKEVSDPAPEGEAPPAEEPKPEAVALDDIIQRVAKEFGMEQLSEEFALLKEKADKVEVLEGLVRKLVKSNEDKLAEMISPPATTTFAWMQKRASESKETVLDPEKDEDKKLAKSKPEYWLSEATGTQPVQVQ